MPGGGEPPPPPCVPPRKKQAAGGQGKGRRQQPQRRRHQQGQQEDDAFAFTGEEGKGGGKGQRMSVRANMVRLTDWIVIDARGKGWEQEARRFTCSGFSYPLTIDNTHTTRM